MYVKSGLVIYSGISYTDVIIETGRQVSRLRSGCRRPVREKRRYDMISQELKDQFRREIDLYEKNALAFEAGELDRGTFKGISGGFGSYAQRDSRLMLRLRIPGGCLTKELLKFLADEIADKKATLLKLTTCQTVQVHNLSAASAASMMRNALEAGIITRGGGGDNPRNVMASPLSGVEKGETFNVMPYVQTVGDYLLTQIPSLHMPRKLKVGFSNTPANEAHATFRDLGFIAREDGTFSVYCAGGLGPNPLLGVHIVDGADPEEVTLYVSAMIRLFTAYGNYDSRAKARTRYLQKALGEDGIRTHFLEFLAQAREEETPWPIPWEDEYLKEGDGVVSGKRIIEQKQPGLYTVSYHPIGGCLPPEKPAALYETIKDMTDTEVRLSPDGTLYIINLKASEVPAVLAVTDDGAGSLFETSVSCIGASICQHGIQDSQELLRVCVERIRKENFADGVLPKIHISGCPSSCGSHQVSAIGFMGQAKKVDSESKPAFRLFFNGCDTDPGARIGEAGAVLLADRIPEFLAELGRMIQSASATFETWYPEHRQDLADLASRYAC